MLSWCIPPFLFFNKYNFGRNTPFFQLKFTQNIIHYRGFGHNIDEDKAKKQILYAIDNGVNYIDTEMPYHQGKSEPFVGKILEESGYRDKVKLATKLPHWHVKRFEDMAILLNGQLKNLRTEIIDYYLIHALNGETWERVKNLEIIRFFNQAKKDGRIRYAGFSFHGNKEDFKNIVDGYDWDFCQIQ